MKFMATDPVAPVNVLLLENIHPVAEQAFAHCGYQVQRLTRALPEAELAARLADVHVLGIRSKTQLTARLLDAAPALLSVGAFCIGTNQVDLAHANGRGVPVFNAPFSNTRSVAEMVIAEIIMLARQLGDRSREIHEGKWQKVAAGCHEVRGKTLGIVGYGHIGRQVGVLAEAMGLRVQFFDIAARLPMGNNRAASSLEEVLRSSDFVTLHVPETTQTRGMIGAAELAIMAKGSYVINASRGTVVDLHALAQSIRSAHLAGAALDVFPEEPDANSNGFVTPVRGLPNIILTPHVGGSTEEAQEAIGREVATALIKFLRSGATVGAVNFPEVDLPPSPGAHRIINVHRNVPGVLRDINRIVSDCDANIRAQMLATSGGIGYLVMDLDQDVADRVHRAVAALDTNIRTRIVG
jgi:D-3-phosphoglycerate dehydrogenase